MSTTVNLEFTLTVTDSDGVSASDTVVITITDTPATARFSIGGSISGNSAAVTLDLNGLEETFPGPSFTFVQQVDDGAVYAVQFVSTPSNQVCGVKNGGGVAVADVTNVEVTCSAPITELRYPDAEVTGSLSHGDFDGDGFVDLVFTIRTLDGHPSGTNNRMLRVTYGTGAGGFSGVTDIFGVGLPGGANQRGHTLISGDFNGDAVEDFAYSGSVGIQVLAGAADKNHTSVFSGSNFGGEEPLYTLDADGDNDLDFVALDFDPILHLNQGTDFDNAQVFDSSLIGSSINMVLGDFNGDGLDDILEIGQESITDIALALFPGNVAGSFDLPSLVEPLSSDLFLGGNVFDIISKEMTAGDFDADGDLDIAITSTTNFLQIMLNDGSGQFTVGQRVLAGNEAIHIRAADFDNDSVLDLATINQTSRTAVISLGNGDGTFADSGVNDPRSITLQLDLDVDLRDMNIVDIDGDGFLDILFAEDGTNPPNTGRGSVQFLLAPAR